MDDLLLPCPQCRTKLRVPVAYLGKVVSCLECKAALLAPTRTADGELTRGLTEVPPGRLRGGFPPRVFIPMAALILLGFAGLFVNAYFGYLLKTDPNAAEQYSDHLLGQMQAVKMLDLKPKNPDAEPNEQDEERKRLARELAAARGDDMFRMAVLFAAVSALVLAGGLSFAFKKPYWLAYVGCVAAAVNLNHGCCFPGAIAGIWGFFVLISEEGRRFFGRGN